MVGGAAGIAERQEDDDVDAQADEASERDSISSVLPPS
jgi:hypothetical protein